jgi:hypothetical protein
MSQQLVRAASEQLRYGMPYKEARQMLIDGGWWPTSMRWQDKAPSCNVNIHQLCKLPETQWCTNTGSLGCLMRFSNMHKRILLIGVDDRHELVDHFYYE